MEKEVGLRVLFETHCEGESTQPSSAPTGQSGLNQAPLGKDGREKSLTRTLPRGRGVVPISGRAAAAASAPTYPSRLPPPSSQRRPPPPATARPAIALGRAAIWPAPLRSCPPGPATCPAPGSRSSRGPGRALRPRPPSVFRFAPRRPTHSDPETPRVGLSEAPGPPLGARAGSPRGRLASLRASQLIVSEPACPEEPGAPRL